MNGERVTDDDSSDDDDRSLVSRAVSGETAALEQVVRLYTYCLEFLL